MSGRLRAPQRTCPRGGDDAVDAQVEAMFNAEDGAARSSRAVRAPRRESSSSISSPSSADEPAGSRRIMQWILRVSQSGPGDKPSLFSEEPDADETHDAGLCIRGQRQRRYYRVSRPVPNAASNTWLCLQEKQRSQTRTPSVLWQMTTDRLLLPWRATCSDIWLLGEHYGPDASDMRSMSRSSDDSSSTQTSKQGREWRALLESDIGSLVWCTYRDQFPPIAWDGSIGDEEGTAKAVTAATEQLYAQEQAARPTQETDGALPLHAAQAKAAASPMPTLMQTLLQSANALCNTSDMHGWLMEQLELRRWQLPQLLLPGAEHARLPGAASLREMLGRHTQAGLPGLWSCVRALYDSALSFVQPAGFSSDVGWGCMLRTAQSLLANALLRAHLGRQWRRSAHRDACYVRILSWFLDDPSCECPFSVHRLAAEGCRLGVPVGTWFGPSAVGTAMQRLVQAFPACGMGVVLRNDGLVCMDEVRAASIAPGAGTGAEWTRPVLVLVAQRTGLNEVPPPYRGALKQVFTFPQSVGIAGGRPGSSLYFVGTQREHLLYLDPHYVRASVPFRHPPPSLHAAQQSEAPALLDSWYDRAYSVQELATFHTSQTASMPLSMLDPSMLLGFLCSSAADLADLETRAHALDAPLIDVQSRAPPVPTRVADESDDEGWTQTAVQ